MEYQPSRSRRVGVRVLAAVGIAALVGGVVAGWIVLGAHVAHDVVDSGGGRGRARAPVTVTTSTTVAGGESLGFLADTPAYVDWVTWVEDNGGHLVGSLSELEESPQEPGTPIARTYSIAGVRNGSQVSLTVDEGLGATTTWSGTASGDRFALLVTRQDGTIASLDMRAATVNDYNAAAERFREAIDQRASDSCEGIYAGNARCSGQGPTTPSYR